MSSKLLCVLVKCIARIIYPGGQQHYDGNSDGQWQNPGGAIFLVLNTYSSKFVCLKSYKHYII